MSLSKIIKSSYKGGVIPGRTIAIKSVHAEALPLDQLDDISTQQTAEMKLQALEQKAQQMLDEAELQSEQMMELFEQKEKELSLQADQLFEEQRLRGYEAGFTQGKEEALAEYAKTILAAQDIVIETENQRQEQLDQAEMQMIRLGCVVAEKILGQAFEQDETKLQWLKKLLYEAREHEDLKLFIPPVWYTYVIEHEQSIRSILLSSTNLLIIPDHQLDSDSCVIESKQGRLETSLNEQLSLVKEQLLLKQKELIYAEPSSV